MVPEASLPRSQKLITNPYPEPDELLLLLQIYHMKVEAVVTRAVLSNRIRSEACQPRWLYAPL
jgi:hypothetical protein